MALERVINPHTGKFERIPTMGLPKGNLNKRPDNRGYTRFLLTRPKNCWSFEDYEPQKEQGIPKITSGKRNVQFICMKPKQFPVLLESGDLDMAIIGRDTVEERYSRLWAEELWSLKEKHKQAGLMIRPADNKHEPISVLEWYNHLLHGGFKDIEADLGTRIKHWNSMLEKANLLIERDGLFEVMDLGYGKIDVCFGRFRSKKRELIRDDLPLKIISSYPNITYRDICRYVSTSEISLAEDFTLAKAFSTLKESMPIDIISIFPMYSNVETIARCNMGDLMVDCVSSGESFRKYDIENLRTILKTSTARLYSSSSFAKAIRRDLGVPDLKDYIAEFLKSGNSKNEFDELVLKLHEASLIYGKTRPDSIYYKGEKTI